MKIEFSQIQGATRLSKGAQASVYLVPAGALHPNITIPVAVKKYKSKIVAGNEEAVGSHLKGLIQSYREFPDNVRKFLTQHTVWPRGVIYENGLPCGFAMNLIPSGFSVKYEEYGIENTADSNLDTLLNSDEIRRSMGMPAVGPGGRAKITYSLLRVLWLLNKSGFVLGDISPRNIMVYVDPVDQRKNRVLLLDCDSFRKKGHTHPLTQPHTVNWFPPEAQQAAKRRAQLEREHGDPNQILRYKAMELTQNDQTDVYKICLAILRIYHNGDQRSAICHSPEALERIERELGGQFARAIEKGLSDVPGERPSAELLLKTFSEALRQKQKR